jgi:acyl carrier protein
MKKKDIEKKIVDILAEEFDWDPDDISPDTTLEELGADSLDQVEILMYLEEEFDIDIPDDVSPELRSVQVIIDYLVKEGVCDG